MYICGMKSERQTNSLIETKSINNLNLKVMKTTIIPNVFTKDVVTSDKTGKLSFSIFPVITEYDKENGRLIAHFSNGTKAFVSAYDKTLYNTAAIAVGFATCYKIDHCPDELPTTGWVEFDEIVENRKINAALTN